MTLSHVDESGRARMVDVGGKPETERRAVAEGAVRMSVAAFHSVRDQALAKGDVLPIAELAGTMGAKRTAELIPLCHPIALNLVAVRAELDEDLPGVRIRAETQAVSRTGVEMEALVAVSIGCLTVYDMVKAIDRGAEVRDVRLVEKTGGQRGPWQREP